MHTPFEREIGESEGEEGKLLFFARGASPANFSPLARIILHKLRRYDDVKSGLGTVKMWGD